jgi:O-antigen/teichoic acid export membrane protein
MQDIKGKAIRGGLARIGAQGAGLLLRMVALVVLARLLSPTEYGLVGMVTACTGVLTWFRDFGLSSAVIQRPMVTEEQVSTLFWINLLFGILLALATVVMAPVIASFYREPRLLSVTIVLAFGFLFNAAGVQHSARLQREMRFTVLAAINVISLMAGISIAIVGAAAGYGYWALVAMSVASPLTATIGFWLVTGWIPGKPRRGVGIRSMLHFGGALTLNGLVAYFAFNADKIIVGRAWGADAIGIYGRAFQLVGIPIDNLNSAIGEVAFSALSRLQEDPIRLKAYFLKGFSLVLGLTLPCSLACGLFADDGVYVFLGSKWSHVAPIVRLLSPTIAVYAIINPLGWLVFSLGLVGRGLKMALVLAPLMIAGYVLALPYGPTGVALAYSGVMTFWVLPHVLWCIYGTVITFGDVLRVMRRPLASGIVAVLVAMGSRLIVGEIFSPVPRLLLESCVLFLTFFTVLLCAVEQRSLYANLVVGLKGSSGPAERALASAPKVTAVRGG